VIRSAKILFATALFSTISATAALADGAVMNNTRPGTPEAAAMASAAPLDRFIWGGIGYYGARYSFDCGDFSGVTTCSATDGAFGLQVGAALAFTQLAPNLKLDGWGSIAGVFGSGNYFPINLGVGVTYDALPVALFGGLGFSIVPNTGNTAVGLDINLMAIYPVPQVVKGLGLMGQLQVDILNENLLIWNLIVGGTFSF